MGQIIITTDKKDMTYTQEGLSNVEAFGLLELYASLIKVKVLRSMDKADDQAKQETEKTEQP